MLRSSLAVSCCGVESVELKLGLGCRESSANPAPAATCTARYSRHLQACCAAKHVRQPCCPGA